MPATVAAAVMAPATAAATDNSTADVATVDVATYIQVRMYTEELNSHKEVA